MVHQPSPFTDPPGSKLNIDCGVRIGNAAGHIGMDDFRGSWTPRSLAWPGWAKAACLLVLSVAAWVSVILPAIWFFG
jgi:hypothetical protein